MSGNYYKTLIINIKVSLILGWLLAISYGGAVVLLLWTPLPWGLRVLFGSVLMAGLWQALRIHAVRRSPASVTALQLDPAGHCSVCLGDNTVWHRCFIVTNLVHPWVVVLTVRLAGRRWPRGVVIPFDAVDRAQFRQLRVHLKHGTELLIQDEN